MTVILALFVALASSQHTYTFVNGNLGWDASKAACEALNPPQQLAIIQTQAEWQAAIAAIQAVTASNTVMVHENLSKNYGSKSFPPNKSSENPGGPKHSPFLFQSCIF